MLNNILDEDYDENAAEKDHKTNHEIDSAVITSKPGESGCKRLTRITVHITY